MNTDSPKAPGLNVWRKSSYSTSTGNCVEVAPSAGGVAVRHSKRPAAGTITLSHPAWSAFLRDAREGGTVTNGVVAIARVGGDMLVTSLTTEVELRFDEGEWSAFLAGVADGEFDFAGRITA
ncbi:DUF397 domain-containing protein [Actinophytocola gossypii]|uniref:DUF397 domain-containing protein n=1 Tax=Actinophytocola gossypii TaxID=2812003 RepID=A0ABT2J5G0_9PSEU|nr:DUF397 domain-containing protein [Actinophytocola gossypii]MCT2582911.1 DUF397 domain-containing protein [Actinophytocola gossypii]